MRLLYREWTNIVPGNTVPVLAEGGATALSGPAGVGQGIWLPAKAPPTEVYSASLDAVSSRRATG